MIKIIQILLLGQISGCISFIIRCLVDKDDGRCLTVSHASYEHLTMVEIRSNAMFTCKFRMRTGQLGGKSPNQATQNTNNALNNEHSIKMIVFKDKQMTNSKNIHLDLMFKRVF